MACCPLTQYGTVLSSEGSVVFGIVSTVRGLFRPPEDIVSLEVLQKYRRFDFTPNCINSIARPQTPSLFSSTNCTNQSRFKLKL